MTLIQGLMKETQNGVPFPMDVVLQQPEQDCARVMALHLDEVPGIHIPLVDLLVSATGEQHVLLVLVRVQLGDVVHLAVPEGADDCAGLRVPELHPGLVVAAAQEFGAVVVEVDVPHALQGVRVFSVLCRGS